MKPTIAFELVQYSTKDVASVEIARAQSEHLIYILVLGVLVFLYFFIGQFAKARNAKLNIRKGPNRGAALVEMALLIALICMIALVAVENMGQRVKCSFYSSSQGLGFAWNWAVASECCPIFAACTTDFFSGETLCKCFP